MKKYLLILCSALLFSATTPVKYVTVKMVDGVWSSMPKDFVVMSDDDVAKKYPSTKKPVAMYTNLDRTVDYGLNISKSKWGGADLKLLKDIYKSTILQSYDTVTFIKEDIVEVNGRPYIRYEFDATFDGNIGYHYMMISILVKTNAEAIEDKDALLPGNAKHIMIFNFYAPVHLKATYQPIAETMLMSLKVNTKQASKAIPEVPQPQVKGLNSQQLLQEQNKRKATKK
ncbi:MAG: hypothetical protein U0U66_10415 [Cytophagaceae bacterium]